MDKYSNQEIINAFKTSDSQIIKYIYADFYPMVKKLVKTNNGRSSDAEDLLSDALTAFLIKLDKNPNFTLNCSFRTFIYSICRNLWLVSLKKKRKIPLEFYDDSFFSEAMIDDFEMEEFIKDTRKYLLYLKHFNTISEICQKVIQLFLDKVPLAEIAKATGVTEKFAKKRNYECKGTLTNKIMADPEFEMIVTDNV